MKAPVEPGLVALSLRESSPDFIDLPWHLPLAEWAASSSRVVEMERGLSRHEVVFVEVRGDVFALKELPPRVASREYDLLRGMEERRLPSVVAVGHARARVRGGGDEENGVLITQFLDGSLPYRTLFQKKGLERYRERLLDAMAGLLVRLHIGGFYWGDCSLSNTLFRRDAGELAAYAVDAETSEQHERLSDGQRALDLMILEENIAGELADLSIVAKLPAALSVEDTGRIIRERYERLWSEIERPLVIRPDESYRIQERVRTLNDLGFTVGEMELVKTEDGQGLRLRTLVVDRDYHRRLLHSLTGLEAGDREAKLLLNDLNELKATLTQQQNRSISLSAAAFRWQEQRFRPTLARVEAAFGEVDPAERYCEVLEHKWYLSERAQRDVGLDVALEDYVKTRSGSFLAVPAPPEAGPRKE
jgi:hypothetical protein